MKIITERRLSDVIVGVIAIVIGIAGVFLPHPISKIISEALTDGLSTVLYAGLILAGVAVIWGSTTRRIMGPAYMCFGLFLCTGYFLAYSVTALIQAWPLTIVAATPFIVLSIANLFRIYEVSRGARAARAAVFKKV